MRNFIIHVLLTSLLAAIPAFAEDAAGDWVGQMNSGFKVRIHIDKTANGYSGHLTNPSGNETAFDDVVSDGAKLHFAVAKLTLSYDGLWDNQSNAWNGNLTFQQVYPLNLTRAKPSDLEPAVHKRPQEEAIAASTPPYSQSNVVFSNAAASNQLAGTLTLPIGPGPFPAVVLVSGTGHNTRDEDVYGHKVFLVLADAFTRQGVAVLRYDKRGVGDSTGDYDSATTADFASDAQAAVKFLQTQTQIDPKRVGILGHSEGGIIAPSVAAADPTVAFVIMIAGPTIRGDKLFVLQSAVTAKDYGAPDDYIAKRKIFDQQLFDAVRAASSDVAAIDGANAVVAKGLAEKLIDAKEAESLPRDVSSHWERHFLSYDPAPTLAKIAVPILVLNGSLDAQVPAPENLASARVALKSNPKATIVELPGLNHLLQHAKTGGPNEYNDIEETISPAALKLITDWATQFARK